MNKELKVWQKAIERLILYNDEYIVLILGTQY